MVLPLGLVLHGPFDGPETVEVLYLDDRRGTESLRTSQGNEDVDVGVTAEAAFLHLAIGDFQLSHQEPNFFEIRFGFFWRAQIGMTDDLEQGRAGAVQVHKAPSPLSPAAGERGQ